MDEIFAGLDTVLKIVDTDSDVLIQSFGTKLYVASNNEYHAAIHEVVTDTEPFRIVLEGESAKQLHKAFYGGSISVDDNILTVDSDGSSAEFLGLTGKEKLTVKRLGAKYTADDPVSIEPTELLRLFSETKHAAGSRDVGDVRFTGYHICIGSSTLEVMATDGSVISLTDAKATYHGDDAHTLVVGEEFSVVPALMPGAEKALLAWKEGTISTTFTKGKETLRVVSNIIAQSPILYQEVVEKTVSANTNEYIIPRSDFVTALNKVIFFTGDDQKQRIDIEVEGSVCTFRAKNNKGSVTAISAITPLVTEHEKLKFGINLTYLLAFLKSTKYEDIHLWVNTDKTPILFTTGTGKEIIAVFNT
ncbi:MAG: hypothetical protein WC965_01790 [Thiohalomonadaceae bacterium]